MSNSPDVRFFRRNGRIIPIKMNKAQKSQVSDGAKMAAAGLGVGMAGGFAYRKVNRVATSISSKAFRSAERVSAMFGSKQGTFTAMLRRKQAQDLAMRALSKGRAIGAFAKPIRVGSLAVASTLIGAGAAKIHNAFSKGKKKSDGVGVGGAVGSAAGISAFLIGGYGKAGVKSTADSFKKAVAPHLPKLKAYASKVVKVI